MASLFNVSRQSHFSESTSEIQYPISSRSVLVLKVTGPPLCWHLHSNPSDEAHPDWNSYAPSCPLPGWSRPRALQSLAASMRVADDSREVLSALPSLLCFFLLPGTGVPVAVAN